MVVISGSNMLIAPEGQLAMHAPQPVQLFSWTNTSVRPPKAGRNLMAPNSHEASQARHTTPFLSRHLNDILACHGHVAGRSALAPVINAPRLQASPHRPQKVHPRRAKLTTGNLFGASSIKSWGQALTQAAQPSHCSIKYFSGFAPGGRIPRFRPLMRRKNPRLSIEIFETRHNN